MELDKTKQVQVNEIKKTLEAEFPDLKFPPEFAMEVADFLKKEPPSGWDIEDIMDLIDRIARTRKVPVKDVLREIFYNVLGAYLVSKYGGDKNDHTAKNPG